MSRFELLPCPPYNCRVTLHGCIKRHKDSQALLEPSPIRGNATLKRAALAAACDHCVNCPLGRSRAAESDPKTADTSNG